MEILINDCGFVRSKPLRHNNIFHISGVDMRWIRKPLLRRRKTRRCAFFSAAAKNDARLRIIGTKIPEEHPVAISDRFGRAGVEVPPNFRPVDCAAASPCSRIEFFSKRAVDMLRTVSAADSRELRILEDQSGAIFCVDGKLLNEAKRLP